MEHALNDAALTVADRSEHVNYKPATEAIEHLHNRGAQFVLCDGKHPQPGRPFKTYRPPLELVRDHVTGGGNLGIVPQSIGTSALDVDYGDPAELLSAHPARVAVPSRRRGGLHIYYDHDESVEQRDWTAYGCGGEARSKQGGYLVLYHDACQRLAEAIDRPGAFSFPADLWVAVGEMLPTVYAPLDGGAPPRPVADYEPAILENIAIGGRHPALYDLVRHKAYQHDPEPIGPRGARL